MNLGEDSSTAQSASRQNKLPRAKHRLFFGLKPRQPECPVGLYCSAQLAAITEKEFPPSVLTLFAQKVAACSANAGISIRAEYPMQHDVFGREGDIRFELCPPEAFRILLLEEIVLSARDRI